LELLRGEQVYAIYPNVGKTPHCKTCPGMTQWSRTDYQYESALHNVQLLTGEGIV